MPIQVKKRCDIPDAYKWDLTPMFADDGAWERAFSEIDRFITELLAFKGTLNTAERIAELEAFTVAVSRKIELLFCYASQREDEDGRETAAQVMMGKIYGKYVEFSTAASFINPEILSLPDETLQEILNSEVVAPYRRDLELLIRQKPHTLSGAEERLLSAAGEIISAPGDISSKLEDIDMVYDPVKDSEGNEIKVTGAGYISLQESSDRVLRENAFRSYYKGFKGHINTFAATYATNVKADIFRAKARKFPSAREMAAFYEEVPTSVYDGLIEAVRRHLPAMHRYAALRKEMLGLDELHYYDLYTPLVSDIDASYTYEQAQELVLDAVAPLGKTYCDNVRRAFAERWLDVYPNEGKRGGAYSGGCYDSNPYILLNFTGSLDSVSTIAHEMGHSMHSYASRTHQPPQTAEYKIFVAEVASTVNENLLVEKLLSQNPSPEFTLFLLNQYLENFKGTVYRQTMFAEFEKRAHEMQESGNPISAEGLCDLYAGLVKDYFGEALTFDEDVRYEWARIPHFYRSFYVYKYATSYAASVAITESILSQGEVARDRYLSFLSLGGSMPPIDELKVAGVDMSTAEPIDRALEKFERILDKAESLYRSMKLS